MCLAIPGKIIKINGERAIADFNGIKKEINISFVSVNIGDYVVVHAGFAIEKISGK
ncbi:HypC/HybG/HupF family hydrogenase formation chaperone [Candidatus Falkowbacteria bacterium]|nr:HypC/HybG/HupF family hydrogenase formation chaperone [Candidatus Falkowbacteria bacterium]